MNKATLKVLIVFCILLFRTVSSFAQDIRSGLEFNSFELVQEKRTSLNLSPSKDFSFSKGFSLSFDVFLHSTPEYNYGNIFRIIGVNNRHLDFLATPDKLTVVSSEDKVLAECLISETSNNFSSFFPVRLNLDINGNILKITIGKKEFSQKVSSLEYYKKVSIVFGKCDYPSLQTSDVPKMIIKDIRINNNKGDPVYYWKLSKHVENGVYDELKNHFAKVENPKWLLDNHAFWNKKISFNTLKNPQIAYNSNENMIAIADRRSLFIYDTFSGKLVRYDNTSGFVHSASPNQMIYNPPDSTYYSYCFLRTEGYDVVPYNFSNKSWNNNSIREDYSEYWHHNRYVSPEDDCLYLFGGYGQHQYKNRVNKYSFQTRKWDRLQYKGDSIYPRYLSGLGVIDTNRLLLFGGYGSNTGLQILSPKNYYDLYEINLPDLRVKKIWEMEPPKDQFVVANSMIVDTLNKCFYALCFPQNQYETSLFFAKFSMQKPEYEIVSNSIPFYFNDILSYADLFLNKKTKELYAITFSSLSTDSLATVSIYSLSYPPLSSKTSVYQSVNDHSHRKQLIAGIIFSILIFAVIGYLLLKKKKIKAKPEGELNTDAEIDTDQEWNNSMNPDEEFKITQQENNRNKKQSIFLFGGFQVKDKNGNDVTGEFSPMLRQLFLIILLNTLKEDGQGISSVELDDALWPNKTRSSARNNRSVMISRLRQIFENVGFLNIESINSYWVVKLGDEIYCDYREALSLIQAMKNKDNRTKENVMKLLNTISYGVLLPNIQAEWVDSYKANFANQLIDLLTDITKQKGLELSPFELFNLADTLLIYDLLNDEALKLKCRSLIKMGKNGLAKAVYNSFARQYSTLFGTDYYYTFNQIVS